MEFGVLGPVTVRRDGQPVEVVGAMLRRLLAVLLCAEEPLSTDALADLLWNGQPPRSAHRGLLVYVHRLRRSLGDFHRIGLGPAGYRLTLGPDELDAAVFSRLCAEAAARRPDDPAGARSLLAQAVGLWRGEPFADIDDVAPVSVVADRLREQRSAALETMISIDLDLGRHAESLAELKSLTAQNPFRERLHGQLMLALYRCGRQADALAAYRHLRRALTEELGIEPMPEIQGLYRQILNGDPALTVAKPLLDVRVDGRARSFLPHDVRDFVGREIELKWLNDAVSKEHPSAVILTAVDGTAGVGKTALALRWAHAESSRFPDGQLYINLRGFGPGQPMRPVEALVQLLRCLGVRAQDMPTDEESAAARFRAALAGKRVLVLLDNVSSVDQVRPLLPGTAESMVLVTSRFQLSGLISREGAKRLTLGLLPAEEALDLLRILVGAERVKAEPAAAYRLTELCARLPLALRISAAHLVDQPHLSISDYCDRLTHGDRVNVLAVAGDEQYALRAILDRSFEALPPQARRSLRLLGLTPGQDFSDEHLAAMAQVSATVAQRALRSLAAAHMVDEIEPGRFAFHDLIRSYAQNQCGGNPDAEPEAYSRLLELLVGKASRACAALTSQSRSPDDPGDFSSAAQATKWLEQERSNLTAAVAEAATCRPDVAVDLAQQLSQYFQYTGHISDWIMTFEYAFRAAEATSHDRAKYFILNSLGGAYSYAGRYEEALDAHTRCVAGREKLEDHSGVARSRNNLAMTYLRIGRYDEGKNELALALETARRLGDRHTEALILSANLPNILSRIGEPELAKKSLLEALAIYREIGTPFALARTLNNLGHVYRQLGEIAAGIDVLTEAQALSQPLGDRYTEMLILGSMADLYSDLGDYDRAIDLRQRAEQHIRDSGTWHLLSACVNSLADTLLAAGRADEAQAKYTAALAVARELGEPHQEGRALAGIGRITGEYATLTEALTILEEVAPADAEPIRALLAQSAARLENGSRA